MAKVELSLNDIEDAVSRMLAPSVRKGALPVATNKYGIEVPRNRDDPFLMLFHFVTLDDFEVFLEFDCKRLEREGTAYIDHVAGLLRDQIVQAHKVRQENEAPRFRTVEVVAGRVTRVEFDPSER